MSDAPGPRAVCVLGHHELDYPRNRVLQEALARGGREIVLCHSRSPFPLRFVVLGAKYLRSFRDVGVVLVTEGGHRLVPAIAALAHLTGRPVLFDPFTSRYNTRIEDRALAGRWSVEALVSTWQDWSSTHAADALVFDTDEHRDYFRSRYALEKPMAVVPVGVPSGAFDDVRHRARPGGVTVRVLFYGTYIPLQGVETIVEAAAALAGDGAYELELIGEGQVHAAARERARRLGVDGAIVRFEPPVAFEDLPQRIAEADLVLGIFGDTDKARRVVPNKVVQAAAVGAPLVTADTPAIRRYFVHGESAWLVPPADSRALAEAIRTLGADHALRARLGAGARAVFEERFSIDAISRTLCGVIDDLERRWSFRTPSARRGRA